jgi:hypothetical protein
MRIAFALIFALCLPDTVSATAHARSRRVLAAELEPLARAALGAALPLGSHVRLVVLPSSVTVGQGDLHVDVASLPELRTGRHSISFLVTAGTDRPVRVAGLADVESAPRITLVRGSMVTVVVRAPGVTIAARGQTQGIGGVGDIVPVLLEGGRKVLTGRVVDGDTVEVTP